MLSGLDLRQFGAFADAHIAFGAGVNVVVGANGTGKTHLMKVAYGAMRTAAEEGRAALPAAQRLEQRLADLFQPDDHNVGRIVRRRVGAKNGFGGGDNKATVTVRLGDSAFTFTLHTKGQRLRTSEAPDALSPAPLFLPPREVLSLGAGFIDLARDYEIPLDGTYADAAAALSRPPVRRRPAAISSLEATLGSALGGEVLEQGGRFYVQLSGGGRMEATLVAEGLRKVAVLIRLLQNGSIATGVTLFWDEPEANLNPVLSRTVAEVVLALGRSGVQVVLATHDYFLASRLSLRLSSGKGAPEVRFIGLSASGDVDGTVIETADGVRVATADRLEDLPEALLVEALTLHADDVSRRRAVRADARPGDQDRGQAPRQPLRTRVCLRSVRICDVPRRRRHPRPTAQHRGGRGASHLRRGRRPAASRSDAKRAREVHGLAPRLVRGDRAGAQA